MPSDSARDKRQKTQEILTACQDRWIAVVEQHGTDLNHPEVRRARKELEAARIAYLNLNRSDD